MQKNIHLIFKPEDADLLGWKVSLLHRTLNKTVNEILLAESKGKTAVVPFEFSPIKMKEPVSCVIRIADENVSRFVEALPKGDKAESIKKIIRKHIHKNKEAPPNEVGMPAKLLAAKIEKLKELLVINSNSYAGEHDKNRKLNISYGRSVEVVFNSILDCYQSDNEENGDISLQNLDIERIINIEFAFVFDEIFKLLQFGIPDEEFENIINQLKLMEETK